jgi:hypothetical protein
MVIGLALLTVAGIFAGGGSPSHGKSSGSPAGAPVLQAMKEQSASDGSFSVKMPGDAKEETQDMGGGGAPMVAHQMGLDTGKGAYVVMWADFPAAVVKEQGTDKALDGARDGAVQNVGGKLDSEKKISVQGNPGREIAVSGPNGMKLAGRLFLVGNRLYQVMAVWQEADASMRPASVTPFLESFVLKGAAKAAPRTK